MVLVGDKPDHEVVLFHHGPDRLGLGPMHRPKSFVGRFSLRSQLALAGPVIGAGPGTVRRDERRVVWMNAEGAGAGQNRMMPHAAKNLVGLGLIVIDALAVPPTMRGK